MRQCQQAVLSQRRRYGFLNLPLGSLALGLTLQGHLDQAREAFVELFRVGGASDWYLFDMFNEACLVLALIEGRHETATRLLGHAHHRSTKLGVRFLWAERIGQARATLESKFEPETFQRLMAEGQKLDEEAVCRLTLHTRKEAFAT